MRGKVGPVGQEKKVYGADNGSAEKRAENGREMESQVWQRQVLWPRPPLDRSGGGVCVGLSSHLELASH